MLPESIIVLAGLNLLFIIALLLKSMPDIRKQFARINRKTWLFLLIIFLFGLSLRLITPHHHMMFTDEYATMEASKNILLNGRAETCEYIDYETVECGPYQKLAGPPFLFSLSFLAFGISSYSAIYLCTALGAISVVLMFLLAYILFKREDVALYSSLLLATYPAHIMWSGSASTNVPGIFFMLLTLLSLPLFFSTGKYRIYLLACLSLAFTLQTRPEFMLLLPLVPVMHLLFDRDFKNRIKDRRFWNIWTVFLLFFVSFLVQITTYLPQIINLIASSYSDINLFSRAHGASLLSDTAFLILMFLAALALFNQRERSILFPASLFLTFFVLFIPLLSDKLLLTAFIGLFLMSAAGLAFLAGRLKGNQAPYVLATVLLLALFFPYVYPYYFKPITYNYYTGANVLETNAIETIIQDVPEGCYVVARQPFLLPVPGLRVVSTETALNNPDAIENIHRNSGCVMFYEELSCFLITNEIKGCRLFNCGYCYKKQPLPECQQLKEAYSAQKYREYSLGAFTYSLYNLSVQT
jgi:hypothetical protein